MDERDFSICAQNANNAAAVVIAAAITAGHIPEGQVSTRYDQMRAHVLATTIASIDALATPLKLGNPQVNYPPPENQGQPQQVQARAEQFAPPPSCNHGTRVFKSGTSSKGPWKAYMCSQPKDAPDRCSPVFL